MSRRETTRRSLVGRPPLPLVALGCLGLALFVVPLAGLVEPAPEKAAAATRDPVDRSLRSGVSTLRRHWFGVAGVDQAIERPVHERSSDREHAPDLALGVEVLGDRKTVAGSFGENAEYDVFGGGQPRCRHGVAPSFKSLVRRL